MTKAIRTQKKSVRRHQPSSRGPPVTKARQGLKRIAGSRSSLQGLQSGLRPIRHPSRTKSGLGYGSVAFWECSTYPWVEPWVGFAAG